MGITLKLISTRIPEQLQQKDFRFIKIDMRDSIAHLPCYRKKALEPDFQTINNYTYYNYNLTDYLFKDNNYGVLCGYGHLAVIDADSKVIEHIVESKLPLTFTVKTGGGGKHYYYLIPDLQKKIVFYDKVGGHYGEIQSFKTYVVGPNCIHKNNNKYEVINNSPIAKISFQEVKQALSDYIFEETVAETVWEGNDEFIPIAIAKLIDLSKFDKHGKDYQGAHPVHGSTTGGNFTVNPTKGVWHCFRCGTGGGALSLIAVLEGIIDCKDARRGAFKGDNFKHVLLIAKQKYGLEVK